MNKKNKKQDNNQNNNTNKDIQENIENTENTENIENTNTKKQDKNTELELLKQKLEETEDKLLRSQADYKNLVKRTESETIKIYAFSEQKIILKLLPVIDNIKRASLNIPKNISDESVIKWLEGYSAIVSSFDKLLESLDVKSFSSLGEEVNTDKHEVLSQGPGEEGKIIQEFEVGYTHKGNIIRPAKVVVGTGE